MRLPPTETVPHTVTYGTVKLAADGTIKYALPCHACGYELRGIDPDSTCPECGAPVQVSIESWRHATLGVRKKCRTLIGSALLLSLVFILLKSTTESLCGTAVVGLALVAVTAANLILFLQSRVVAFLVSFLICCVFVVVAAAFPRF